MKKTPVLGVLAALALGMLAAGPALAHDDCDRYDRSDRGYYGGGYQGGGYYGSGYRGGGYYGGGYGGGYDWRDDVHAREHARLEARHERAHERGFESREDHYEWHKRAAEKHDVQHHHLYGEHAPNHAHWYYGDERDW